MTDAFSELVWLRRSREEINSTTNDGRSEPGPPVGSGLCDLGDVTEEHMSPPLSDTLSRKLSCATPTVVDHLKIQIRVTAKVIDCTDGLVGRCDFNVV